MKKIIKFLFRETFKVYLELKSKLPIKYRKKLKSIYFKIFKKNINIYNLVPIEIYKEWEKWNLEHRKNNSFDLLNFGVIPWEWRYQRPQHFAKNLSKNNRVFYIKNEFYVGKVSDGFAPFLIEKKDENIYEITLSASRNLFIYTEKPKQKDIEIIAASLKNLIYQANILNPIAKVDHPFWENISEIIAMPKIYDCMDNHIGFEGTSKKIIDSEISLIKTSQHVIASSNSLFKKIAKNSNKEKITLIKNAGEYKKFAFLKQNINENSTSDINEITSPIIGYYGAIAEWLDHEIIEDIAINHPDKSIVLIGRVMNNKIDLLAKKYSNIYLLGEKNYNVLPYYLNKFDVAIIPFILNDLIKATHPVKLFEYFAASKPVISVKLPEIRELNKLLYFANKKNFSNKINEALKKNNNNRLMIRDARKYSKNNSWLDRSLVLEKVINRILFPKVSIVLLSYNNHKKLKEAVDSILNRSFYPNFELIIVDNDSDKLTIDTINEYRKDKRVKIILNKENYGFAKGNNIGLDKAKGEYLILLNNDVKIVPGWISRLLFHANKPKVGLVGVVTNNIANEAKINIEYDLKNSLSLENSARLYTSKKWGSVLKLNNIAAFCWIKSAKTYKKIGKLDERFKVGMFEDDDYCRRIINTGYSILCAEDVFIHHYGRESFKQLNDAKYLKIFNENKTKYEDKWKTTWKQHKYRKIHPLINLVNKIKTS